MEDTQEIIDVCVDCYVTLIEAGHESGNDAPSFSWQRCEFCNSSLDGDRYEVMVWK